VFPPERIVCLTEETVETLYLLGEERRIVGVSGYVVRLPRARREKPRVSAFTSADIPVKRQRCRNSGLNCGRIGVTSSVQ
jgi:iron complex transport system substrate-binding protein